jgi:hypothetical protein
MMFWIIATPLLAVKGVELSQLAFARIARCPLDLSTMLAELEPRARLLLPGDGVALTGFGGFAKIHVPEDHPLDELETKRHVRRRQPIRFPDVLVSKSASIWRT